LTRVGQAFRSTTSERQEVVVGISEGSDTALKGGFPLDDAAVRLRDEGDLQRR
jgi:hypothetical protein